MNFKKTLVGAAFAGFYATVPQSVLAQAADLVAPDAVTDVTTITCASGSYYTGTSGGSCFGANTTYAAVYNAEALVISDSNTATNDAQNAAVASKTYNDLVAERAIIDALTAGQLFEGKTKAEIIQAATHADAVIASALTAKTTADSTAALSAKALVDSQAALTVLTDGVISADIKVAIDNYRAASAQTDLNGSNAAGTGANADTLGGALFDATAVLGVANTSTTATSNATLLFKAKEDADAAVTAAELLLASNAGTATKSTVSAVTGVTRQETFTVSSGDVIDLRDDDTQVLLTIGTTAGTDTAADLVALINSNAGLDVTATESGGTVTLTYGTTLKPEADWTAAEKLSLVTIEKGGVVVATTLTAGVVPVAAQTITYDLYLAQSQLAAATAADKLAAGEAAVATAKAAYDQGVLTAKSYDTLSDTAFDSAIAKLASVDSVLSEKITVAEAVVTQNEALAQTAEAIAAEDLADLNAANDALTDAKAAQVTAKATFDAAVAASNASPSTAASQAVVDAGAALAAANLAVANATTAVTAASDVYYGSGLSAETAIASQTGTYKDAVSARSTVTSNTAVVTGLQADALLQVALADPSNPAGVLQAELIDGTDTGGAVVTAVNANYQLTQTNAGNIATNTTNIATNTTNIATNTADIAVNTANIAVNTADIAVNKADIAVNKTDIATNKTDIATNSTNIANNTSMINSSMAEMNQMEMRLNDDIDMLKSGIASALAIAGMPTAPGEGLGFAIGTGYYDGESAVSMGLTYVDGSRSFKLGVGHAGGETSASAGMAFKF